MEAFMTKKKIAVINGPNLNMLGVREKSIYGSMSLEDINKEVLKKATELDMEVEFFQSNHEGEIIDKIHSLHNKIDCIIINPGAFTHYSIAIRDAIGSVSIPTIEAHLSNIYTREEFRHKSVIAPVCIGQVSGFGDKSYLVAIEAAKYL
jgi:3-dehydroquinate dehydratase-2